MYERKFNIMLDNEAKNGVSDKEIVQNYGFKNS